MTTDLIFSTLLEACRPGGASALTITTELRPAAGSFAGIAPARFVRGSNSTYAFGKRFLPTEDGTGGEAVDVVTIDGKGSSLNRVEAVLTQAIRDEDGPLAQTPHMSLTYPGHEALFDTEAPHRFTDGHFRAGMKGGTPVPQDAEYMAARNCTNANLRPLLELSPASIVFGVWDSTRKSNQLRLRSGLVGETIGVLADQVGGRNIDPRGGARVDPIAASVQLDAAAMEEVLAGQRHELSAKNVEGIDKDIKAAKKGTASASRLGLGAIPPSLEELGLVSCSRIIRTHVLSFSALRQLRFGFDAEGNAVCRALLAAFALDALVRSYAELTYRANCDLVEAEAPKAVLDGRRGKTIDLNLPEIDEADALLSEAIERAKALGIRWEGQVYEVDGNPAIVRGAAEESKEA